LSPFLFLVLFGGRIHKRLAMDHHALGVWCMVHASRYGDAHVAEGIDHVLNNVSLRNMLRPVIVISPGITKPRAVASLIIMLRLVLPL
jgi:hypothetical protein